MCLATVGQSSAYVIEKDFSDNSIFNDVVENEAFTDHFGSDHAIKAVDFEASFDVIIVSYGTYPVACQPAMTIQMPIARVEGGRDPPVRWSQAGVTQHGYNPQPGRT